MSGFAGFLSPAASQIAERDNLRRMASGLATRSPGGLGAWEGTCAGLVQGTARPPREAAIVPRSLAGDFWIVGDVRLAARGELLNRLRAADEVVAESSDDLLLLLHAYRAWGTGCTRFLLGDFSFGIWDRRRQRIFAARDPLGVKPFFYASPPDGFVFSNTLDAVCLHSGVGDALDDRFIGDYLLFTQSLDTANTVYADVRRLPPGHSLTAAAGGEVRLTRYWHPPEPSELKVSSGECVERFREVLTEAVSDCLDGSPAGIMLSGGLDSTMIAAVAAGCVGASRLRGYTIVFEDLYADPERAPAREAAEHIGIAQIEHIADPFGVMQNSDDPAMRTPEPSCEPLHAMTRALYRRMAEQDAVVLTGFDGDALLGYAFDQHVTARLRSLQLRRLAREVAWLASRRPLQPVGIRSALRRWLRPPAPYAGYPQWISPELERSQGLRDRWVEVQQEADSIKGGRSPAHRQLRHPVFPRLFEYFDAQWTCQAIDFRHPFMDLRVADFLVSLAAVPWCVGKHLFRQAARGWLPDSIRSRPKTPLPVDLAAAITARTGASWWTGHVPAAEMDRYISWKVCPQLDMGGDASVLWSRLRVIGLSAWLNHRALRDSAVLSPLT
jgi:asparagine synthase (glutamine-hydrolysing)